MPYKVIKGEKLLTTQNTLLVRTLTNAMYSAKSGHRSHIVYKAPGFSNSWRVYAKGRKIYGFKAGTQLKGFIVTPAGYVNHCTITFN